MKTIGYPMPKRMNNPITMEKQKQRLRGQIETYLNYLKSKELLRAYDYTPFKEIATKDSNKLSNVSKSDLYIKL